MRNLLILSGILIFTIGLLAVGSSYAFEPLELTDDENDVERTKYVQETVPGFEDIDIISLTSVDETTFVTVTLTVKGEIISEIGTQYSIWIGMNYVDLMDGEFDIDPEIKGDVETEISGSDMVIKIQRTALVGSYWSLSATTYQYDPMDISGMLSGYSYSDTLYDEERSRAVIEHFDEELTDDEGDVVHNYAEVEEVDNYPHLDIISVETVMVQNGDVEIILSLKGNVVDDPGVSYDINIDYASIHYSDGGGSIYYYETEDESQDVVKEGRTIIATLDGGIVEDVQYLTATTSYYSFESEYGEHYSDYLSNDPFDDDFWDMFMFLIMGSMEMTMDLDLKDVDLAELKTSYVIGENENNPLLREHLDTDGDGIVEQEEIEDLTPFFAGEDMEDEFFGLDVLVDGKTGEKSFSSGWEGLLGDTDSTDGFSMFTMVTYMFDVQEAAVHTIVLRPVDDGGMEEEDGSDLLEEEIYDQYQEDEEIEMPFDFTFRIGLPTGWKIVLSSVQPSFMTDYVSEDRRSIELAGDDLEAIGEPQGDIVSFDISSEGGGVNVDDDDVNNDSPFPFWIPVSALLAALLALGLLGSRRR